jgi:AcrR family transcriptional regulator
MKVGTPAKRGYRMVARADATAALRERILGVADDLFSIRSDRFSLDEVADAAGTTVQTVLRHFGSKEGLIEATLRRTSDRIRAQRAEAPAGDVRGAIRNLLDHYEEYGDRALRMLAEESRSAVVREAVANGRALHRQWISVTFAAQLDGLRGRVRQRRFAQLVAICDVYVWKLFRRDLGLERPATETALVELIEALEGP